MAGEARSFAVGTISQGGTHFRIKGTQIGDDKFEEYTPPDAYRLEFREEHLETPNEQYHKDNGAKGTNAEFYILQLAFDNLREDINYKKINRTSFDGNHTFTDRLDWLLRRNIDNGV